MSERRQAIVQILPETLIYLCQRQGAERVIVVSNPLPDDARFVDVRWNVWRGTVEVLVASDTFAPIPGGSEPPVLNSPAFEVVRQ